MDTQFQYGLCIAYTILYNKLFIMVNKSLESLEVYNIARQLSRLGWYIYQNLPNYHKYHIGEQFIESTDSVGANIAEGFGRYHFLDKAKFFINARGSLFESKYWIELFSERKLINYAVYEKFNDLQILEQQKLNKYIQYLRSKAK